MDSYFPLPPAPAGFHISQSLEKMEGHTLILSIPADPACCQGECQHVQPEEVATAGPGRAARPPPCPAPLKRDKLSLVVLKLDSALPGK